MKEIVTKEILSESLEFLFLVTILINIIRQCRKKVASKILRQPNVGYIIYTFIICNLTGFIIICLFHFQLLYKLKLKTFFLKNVCSYTYGCIFLFLGNVFKEIKPLCQKL